MSTQYTMACAHTTTRNVSHTKRRESRHTKDKSVTPITQYNKTNNMHTRTHQQHVHVHVQQEKYATNK